MQAQPTGLNRKQPLTIISIGFSVVVALMLFLVAFGLSRLYIINQQLEKTVSEHNKKAELAYNLKFLDRERVGLMQEMVVSGELHERDELVQRLDVLPRQIAATFDELQNYEQDEQEKAFLFKLGKNIESSAPLQQTVVGLVLDGKSGDAEKLLHEKAASARNHTLEVLEQFANLQYEYTRQATASAKLGYQHAMYYMVASSVVVLVLSVLIAVIVKRRMSGMMTSLRAKEHEARVLLDSIPEMVWLKNCESRYVWANRRFEQVTALASAQLQGLSDKDVWQESEGAGGQSDDVKAMETRTTVHNEKTLTNRAGVSRQYATSRTPILDGAGQCTGVLGVAHDVTERNRMAEEIRETSHELQFQKAALDEHSIASIADIHGNIAYVNDKFCEISQYGRDELVGQNHRVLKSGYHPKAFFDEMWITIAAGRVWQGDICNRAKDGSLYWVKTTIVPFVDENGLPQRYVSIRTDITRTKEAELLLQRSREELEQLVQERTAELIEAKRELEADISERKRVEDELRNRYEEVKVLNSQLQEAQNQLLQSEKMASIGQLAAGVAHEINNPIGYVSSNLGTLEKYVQDVFSMVDAYEQAEVAIVDAGVREQLQAARENLDMAFLKDDLRALMNESKDGITRVKKIVQDLKEFSHVDASDEWHFADLKNGIDSTLNIVNNEIKYKAKVIKEYGDIRDVECLSSQLNQVFMNLLVNAAHAIEERGTITIRTGMQEEEVWVEIADSGKGIAPENLKRIFDPFFTTKPIGKGTGLGLSLSYSIIQKHQGRIEVKSEVGKGTAFKVWLPVRHTEAASAW